VRAFALCALLLALVACGGNDRGFVGRTDPVGSDELQASWRSGCPVPVAELRLLSVSHWAFDGEVRQGKLVVHQDVADDVLEVFRRLFDVRFPIARIRPIDAYGGDDLRSMADNNTSGFNCRLVSGTGRWSEHAYGRAIDINPVQNPFVSADGKVLPREGRRHADRSRRARGTIHADDDVVRAFASIGWSWGGAFRSVKDYQHFSASGQ
jgi:hypothetical protein